MKGKIRNRQSDGRSWLHCDVTDSALKAWKASHDFNGSNQDLIAIEMPDPEQFQNPEQFRTAYWRAELWSKYPFNIEGIDRDVVAKATFHEYERRCADANVRLCDLWNKPIPERYRSILRHAQTLLSQLFRGFSLDEVVSQCNWGPGASTSMRRAQASPQNKWVFAAHITESALPYFYAFSEWSGWVFSRPATVEGNKVCAVPKNAKTNRTIAIEPEWNMFFQLGLGSAIRRRLQRRGLLTSIGKQVNSKLAQLGSVDDSLATIDLKGASDCVSLALVEALFPPSVTRHVLNLRSPVGDYDGERIVYEKISSMGNGCTFELETALFWAICTAASGHAMVFGDDIIVSNNSYTLCCDILQFCGFEVNSKKSYYSSPFRESCGGHYYLGVDVTPPYIKKPLVGPYRISVANRIRVLSERGAWMSSDLESVYRCIIKKIPTFLYGPRDIDGTLWTPLYRSSVLWSSKLQCFKGTRVVQEFKQNPAPVIGAYMTALYGVPTFTQWHRAADEVGPIVRYKTWWSGWHGDFLPWDSGSGFT